MKSLLVIGVCLVASVVAQATTKKASGGCDKDKIPKVAPTTCCPGYPDFSKAPFMQSCGKQCLGSTNVNVSVCCMTTCFLNENKAVNKDGSINAAAVVAAVQNYVASKDKAKYTSFTTKVVNECIAFAKKEVEANKQAKVNCVSAYFQGCVMRKLLDNCPDLAKTKECADQQAFLKSCKYYPMMMMNKPQNGTQQQQQKKPTSAKPPASQDPSAAPPKAPPGKPSAAPANTGKSSAKPAPPKKLAKGSHPSQSAGGTLGANGAGFKDS